jgi:DNA-binding NtrC family response regulator
MVRGPEVGQSWELGAETTVGKGSENDICIIDATVSRCHFALLQTPEGFLLRDRESTNGTFLEGARVVEAYVKPGMEIRAGEVSLRLKPINEEVAIQPSGSSCFGKLVGDSAPMRKIFALLDRVAPTDATILILGETGTGKGAVARAIHERSDRQDKPFVTIDCGAISQNLIESELFGHAKGAFTGATDSKMGLFAEADGGTLFLDEIGELPLDLQPKLLRALETRTVRRLGESEPRPVDVRLVAATNRNLAQEVAARRFRQDLFFRLGVIRLRMPSLRERREEIPRLVSHFVTELGSDPHEALPDPSVISMLHEYHWPGNVRELRNVVERLVLLPGMQPAFYLDGAASGAEGSSEPGDPFSDKIDLDQGFHDGKRRFTELFEREYLARQLRRCKGNISELARVSGLSRQSCHRLLGRYGLSPGGGRER